MYPILLLNSTVCIQKVVLYHINITKFLEIKKNVDSKNQTRPLDKYSNERKNNLLTKLIIINN